MSENSPTDPLQGPRAPLAGADARISRKNFCAVWFTHFAWTGMAVLYYLAFSIFFDTPLEYEMKHSTRMLRQQYDSLSRRYDTIEKVLMNMSSSRDRGVFRTLFESDPYNFDTDFEKKKWEAQEKLLTKSNKELGKLFLEELRSFEKRGSEQLHPRDARTGRRLAQGPVRQHPGHTARHQQGAHAAHRLLRHAHPPVLQKSRGPSGSRLHGQRRFARIRHRRRTHQGDYHQAHLFGQHGGHQTTETDTKPYTATQAKSTRAGATASVGATSSPSRATRACRSLPHLHYEIRHNGMRVDPIHYFFMELDYEEYQKIVKIAQTGMQSFD